MQRQRGLTLLELLVVLAIIGFAMKGVSLSLRDSSQTQLEREAQRLVAILEAARVQSRTSGNALVWQPTPDGFAIRPEPLGRTDTWLTQGTQAHVSNSLNLVVLGPEPILVPVQITLHAPSTRNEPTANTLRIGTDGVRPFEVLP
ncbi:MAG: type II secretion system protein GspH [Limnohabitans sp.]|nr:type II secretion system protein GspH [Limnohabitans sp.]